MIYNREKYIGVRTTLNENISLEKYLVEVEKVLFNNKITEPKAVDEIMKISVDKNQRPTAIEMRKKRIYLCEPWDESSKLYVDCTERISLDTKNKKYRRSKFSFHVMVNTSENQEIKGFRVDFEPGQPIPLHAHHWNDEEEKRHLEYPSDVRLNLNKIDTVTILHILSEYLGRPTEYPLDDCYEKKYNGIINRVRRIYDGMQ